MYIKQHQQLLDKYKRENKQTEEEIIVENILKELNIYYIKQKGFIAKCYSCYIADFYLPKPNKLVIEVDGKYHSVEKRRIADYYRDKFFLEERKIKTLRIKNEELMDINSVKNKIKEILNIFT